ncbi:MAG: RES family NAD+ phosphorylase [Pseudomonadota bacterium]
MSVRPTLRDIELIDAVEALPTEPFSGHVFRAVADGRDPLTCWHPKARWDDGYIDVLYTSLSEDGALTEVRYHLNNQQPFAPDFGRQRRLFRIPVSGLQVIAFRTLHSLEALGVDVNIWGRSSYVSLGDEYLRTQEIAAAAEFHERDGLLVPSARSDELNLVVLMQSAVDAHCGEPEDLGLRDL